MDTKQITRAYLAMREKKREYEQAIKEIEADMDKVEALMLVELKEQKATSINNELASIQYVKRTRFYSSEMPAFRQWVAVTPGAVELFESRLHQGNMEVWLSEHPELVPPGLQTDVKETVRVVAK